MHQVVNSILVLLIYNLFPHLQVPCYKCIEMKALHVDMLQVYRDEGTACGHTMLQVYTVFSRV